jgi:hypothetical protein
VSYLYFSSLSAISLYREPFADDSLCLGLCLFTSYRHSPGLVTRSRPAMGTAGAANSVNITDLQLTEICSTDDDYTLLLTNHDTKPHLFSQHAALVRASQSRTILLCGLRARNVMREAPKVENKRQLQLGSLNSSLFVVGIADFGPIPNCGLISCPQLPAE